MDRDVRTMQLDISKLKKVGWRPKLSSLEAIKLVCEELTKDPMVKIIGS